MRGTGDDRGLLPALRWPASPEKNCCVRDALGLLCGAVEVALEDVGVGLEALDISSYVSSPRGGGLQSSRNRVDVLERPSKGP